MHPLINSSQEMERERLAKEQEEQEKAEKTKKLKESFGDATSQWELDKTEMQDIALKEERKKVDSSPDSRTDAKEEKAKGSKHGAKE